MLFLAIEIAVMAAFINFSAVSKLASTVIFPPLFAVTVYIFVLAAFDVERHGLKKIDYIFAFLLASVALISAGAGFHYAANDINDVFIQETGLAAYIPQQVLERVDYLDEIFSHAVLLTGIAGIFLSAFLWWYLGRFKTLAGRIDINTESGPFDFFILVFMGSMLGGIASLLSIEGQIINYGVAIVSISVVLFLLRFRKVKITSQGKDLVMFCLTFIASYLAVSVAYYLMTKTSAVVFS